MRKQHIVPMFGKPDVGSQKPDVEKFDATTLSEAELSSRLDSFARINSDLDSYRFSNYSNLLLDFKDSNTP